ncbi:MAG: hypothetical protein IJ463_02435 [Bacilli bacterium]|nr:hypothetical protein [Bacilli bacterium]
MKKIVNYIVLIVICVLPVMVDAKVNLEFNKEYDKEVFLFEDEGIYYFLRSGENINEDALYNIYDYDHNLIGNAPLIRDDFESELDIYKYKPAYKYIELLSEKNHRNVIFKNEENNLLYTFIYNEEVVSFINLDDGKSSEISFEDDLKSENSYLGRKYDIYLKFKEKNYEVNYIKECDDVFIVNYIGNEGVQRLGAYDVNGKKIVDYYYEEDSTLILYAHDNLIYVMEEDTKLDIYKLDGQKYQTINISNEKIENFVGEVCEHFAPYMFSIAKNRLYITYVTTTAGCGTRMNYSDVSDIVRTEIVEPTILTLEYDIDYDVETVSSSNGEITYETKVDEDGESYVELKVVPKDGYSVEEIIVTDIYGERIEVTNNKFKKPLNDVTVEVKYVKGEYLPIPDTFLGKSVSLIIIGLVLVSLGFYTINYVRQE